MISFMQNLKPAKKVRIYFFVFYSFLRRIGKQKKPEEIMFNFVLKETQIHTFFLTDV